MLMASELSGRLENSLVVDDYSCRGHHKRRCRLTFDDAATAIGICVGLLAVITGVLVYIGCVDLLMVLSRSGLRWWTY